MQQALACLITVIAALGQVASLPGPQLASPQTIRESASTTALLAPPVLTHAPNPRILRFSNNDRALWSCADSLRRWDVASGTLQFSLSGPLPFADFAPLSAASTIISADRPTTHRSDVGGLYATTAPCLRHWRLPAAQQVAATPIPSRPYGIVVAVFGMAVAEGGNTCAVLCHHGTASWPILHTFACTTLQHIASAELRGLTTSGCKLLHSEGMNWVLVIDDAGIVCIDLANLDHVRWNYRVAARETGIVGATLVSKAPGAGKPQDCEVLLLESDMRTPDRRSLRIRRLETSTGRQLEALECIDDAASPLSAVQQGELSRSAHALVAGLSRTGGPVLRVFRHRNGVPETLSGIRGMPAQLTDEVAADPECESTRFCSLAWSSTESMCAFAFSNDSRILLHALSGQKASDQWSGPGEGASMQLLADRSVFVSGLGRSVIVATLNPAGHPCKRIDCGATVTCVHVASDGEYCAIGKANGTVDLLKMSDDRPFASLPRRGSRVSAVHCRERGDSVSSCDDQGVFREWIRSPHGRYELQVERVVTTVTRTITPALADTQGSSLAYHNLATISPAANMLGVFSDETGDNARYLIAPCADRWRRGECCRARQGDFGLGSSVGGDVLIHDLRNVAAMRISPALKDLTLLSVIAIGSEDDSIALASRDGAIRLYNRNGELRMLLAPLRTDLVDASFSTDGDWIATSHRDGWVTVRECETGRIAYDFRVGDTGLRNLAFQATADHWYFGLTTEDAGPLVHIARRQQ